MSQLLEMLGLPLLACFLMSALLAYAGMHVLKREIIFIDITLAQVAAVGSIIAHLAFGAHEETLLSYAVSLACVLALAALYAMLHQRAIQLPIEAVIGVSYAIAAAGGVFLISLAPTEIHTDTMLAGSLLWIERSDVLFMLVVFAATGLCFYLLHRPLLRVSQGYREDHAGGARAACWDFVFYALIGIVITTAVRIAGVLVVFGFLIMPATISAVFSSRWGIRLLIAWAIGATASAAGLIGAYYLDFSVGPVIALCMGVLLAAVAIVARLRSRLAGGSSRIEDMSTVCTPEQS
ncbi:MAG: metal ABC transporter permease [Sedimentisphaerales bacterium]|nr:metal ABC transporter permease [Sedimentisphaerales bacterium]